MADFIAGVLALVIVIALVGGIVGMISPRRVQFGRGEPPTRKRVAGVASFLFLAAFIGFAITVPEPTPEQKAAAVVKQREAAGAEKREKKQAAMALRAAVMARWSTISEASGCDDRAQIVAALERGDRYSAYAEATRTRDACKVHHATVRDLAPPDGLSEETSDKLDDALNTCADSYLAKQISFDKMLEVIDGDTRPSAVSAAKDAGEFADLATLKCAAAFMQAADAAGIPMEAFKDQPK